MNYHCSNCSITRYYLLLHRDACVALRLCNCHQKTMTKFTSRTSTKKTVFPKKYKKKKRNNDNGKQTTNKPTTNRNVQQFILNRRRRCRRWIESKNHNKRTRLCVKKHAQRCFYFSMVGRKGENIAKYTAKWQRHTRRMNFARCETKLP